MRDLWQEIKRRNVFRVAVVYIVAGWLTMQVIDVMFPALRVPDWVTSAVAMLLLIGFPFALIFAWAFELTPEGIKREKDVDRSKSITAQTGRKLNHAIIGILAVALGFMLFDRFVLHSHEADSVDDAVTASVKPSIAVLPFVNMSDEKENEYFSDGLSEELLNVLAKIPQLHVAGRTSSFQFKGMNQDLRLIGQKLSVANILEGSVRRAGPRIRITAQLIDAENGYHLWSETYDRELTDIFAIQDEIAASVVRALRVTLLGEQAPVIEHGTRNLDAYNNYLQAQYFADRTTAEDMQKAAEALRTAIELDPNYPDAYALLARVHQLIISGFVGNEGVGDFIANFKTVHAYADKALELAPKLPQAYIAKGLAVAQGDWRHAEGEQYYVKALELAPNDVGALSSLAFSRLSQARYEEAIPLAEKALRLDPLSISAHRSLADMYARAGRHEDALEYYAAALRLQPGTARANGRIARIYILRGDFEEAAKFNAREPVEWVRDMYSILIDGRGENSAEFRAAAKAYEEKYGLPNSYQLAEMYGFVGDVESAIHWLETSHKVHDPGMMWLQSSELLAAVKQDPRWPRMLELAGF